MSAQNNPRIPDVEFQERARRVQTSMRDQGIDLLLAYGNEAEPQFLRYLSDYWPSFESGGVLLAQQGEPLLLIGPESLTFAKDRSRIGNIRRLSAFRESSNPEYPGHQLDTFNTVIDELSGLSKPKRVAIAGFNLIGRMTFDALQEALNVYGSSSLVRGDELLMNLRKVKSRNELDCLRFASDITHKTFTHVLSEARPGMTESQVRGLAAAKLFELGAESESYPIWILAGKGSDQAISRARHKIIENNDFVQLQIGARYEGYAATIGRPVFFGKPAQALLDAVIAGYEAYDSVSEQLFALNQARKVADAYRTALEKSGYADWPLYGPCHGTGLMEGEPPWIESNSDYILLEDMTYCVDVFMCNDAGYGFRIEDTVRVGAAGMENLTNFPREIFRI